MSERGYHGALRALGQDAGADLHRVLAAACEPVPARDPVVYLADFACEVLVPLAAGAAEQEVAGTLAGRAFTTGRPVTSDQDGSVRVWVPVVELTTRTGVLAVTVPHAGPQILAQAELLGVFTGLAVAAAARVSDVPHLRRRGQAMSLPAVMQWDMLPPLSARTAGALIAGALEPAYDIAGDAFDYALNGADLHLAIFDGLGHGLGSTLLTGLAVGAYRHARRDGAPPSTRPWPGTTTTFRSPPASSPGWPPGQDGLSGRAPGTRGRCCCAAARSSPSSPVIRCCRSGLAMARPSRAFRSSNRMTRCFCTPTG
jgi:hypothetical protein